MRSKDTPNAVWFAMLILKDKYKFDVKIKEGAEADGKTVAELAEQVGRHSLVLDIGMT